MAEISKIQLPNGVTYDIKDDVARQAVAGGVSFIVAWNGTAEPVVSGIPAGVKVTYNGSVYTGTLSAETTGSGTHAQAGAFYLVKSDKAETANVYDEYVPIGTAGSKTWEKLGNTQVDLSELGDLAYKDNVTLDVSTDVVLGENTTFALTSGSVTFGALTGKTTSVLGSSTTFGLTAPTITVTPTTTNIKATASGAAVAGDGTAKAITGFGTHTTDNFVKSVTPTTSKLVKGSVTGVSGSVTASKVTAASRTASKATAATSQTTATGAGTTSTTNTDWLKGVSVTGEVLMIGAATLNTQTTTQHTFADVNCSEVTANSDVTVPVANSEASTFATGAVASNGTGSSIVTNVSVGDSAAAITALGTPNTSDVLTGVKMSAQPTIALATGATAGTGVISVATGITSASASGGGVTVGTNNRVNAIISMPTGTVGTGITVGTNDKVTVLDSNTDVVIS